MSVSSILWVSKPRGEKACLVQEIEDDIGILGVKQCRFAETTRRTSMNTRGGVEEKKFKVTGGLFFSKSVV